MKSTIRLKGKRLDMQMGAMLFSVDKMKQNFLKSAH